PSTGDVKAVLTEGSTVRAVVKRAVVAAVGIAVLVMMGAAPAWATFTPGPPPLGSPKGGVSSEMIMTGTGAGGGVDGFIGPAGTVSDPSVAYPAAPPTGFTS